MKCANCEAMLSGEPTCPTCGTLYTVSRVGASIPPLVTELETKLGGALAGRYELRGLLGHGGMGAVFLAAESSLDRLVAIKVLPPSFSMDEELLARFQREAKTAARLDHPGIVPIYAVEDVDDLHFYVMKFIPGVDLGDRIPETGLNAEEARRLLRESAVALGHAHRRGVIHRDVKPANIMLDPQGRAVLTDFGIAKAVRSGTAMTSTGQMIGTPQYMSPEQMEGKEVDGRADQYSLGMVAYHMLAGRQPFGQGSVAALLVKQLHEYPESLAAIRPEVPDEIVAAVERAIRKDPDERFETMDDFAEALRPGGAVIRPAAGRRGPGRGRPSGTAVRRWLVGAAAAVVLTAGAALGWSTFSSAEDARAGSTEIVAGETSATVSDGSGPVAGGARISAGGDEPVDSGGAGVDAGAGDAGVGVAAAGAAAAAGDVEPPTTAAAPVAAAGSPEGSLSGTRPAGGAAAGDADPPPATPVEGFLTLNARPFASVDIDGIELPDFTPLNRHPLEPGPHVVVVRREGYVTVVDTVEITAGNVTTRSFVLIPDGGLR